MLLDIVDAGSPVAVEQECKDFADEVVVNLTFFHIFVALGAGMEALLLTALPYFAPLYCQLNPRLFGGQDRKLKQVSIVLLFN